MLRGNRVSDSMSIQVALPGRVLEFNVGDELIIDTGNILGEISNQPAKYALAATLADLASRKLEKLDDARIDSRDVYGAALKQYTFLSRVKDAFIHRKSVLLSLLGNPGNREVLRDYQRDISNLRALMD